MSVHGSNRSFSTLLLYFFAFLLLWEWLRPMGQLTNTGHIEVFIVFLVIAFAGSYFHSQRILFVFIKTAYIFISLYNFYYSGGFFGSWWKLFLKNVEKSIGNLMNGNWSNLSNECNTFLFFILLWLLVYLISFWLLNRQRIFLFFLMTVLYLAILDTFTPYNANSAIVRTMVSGFLVMGMLTFFRLLKQESITVEHLFTRKWMLPLVAMVIFSTAFGILAPKAAPLWPDPVPFIKSLSEKNTQDGTGGIAKIGYGTNDSHLGGPFIADKTPVFKVLASSRHYWQVESKDSYTGKGWVASVSGTNLLPFELGFPGMNKKDVKLIKSFQNILDRNRWWLPLSPFPENVPFIKENAQLYMDMNYTHVIYPAGLSAITASRGTHFTLDQDLAKIYAFDRNQQPVALKNYVIDFDVPKYKMSELTKITDKDTLFLSPVFLARYTEVPPKLPLRVKKLAEKITASKTNWYDKAKAVESYFNQPEFTYDQKDVAVPGKNDDYVDQFLFNSKRGYCDNFSTSMAVMLRTIGIPTRWIKGYSGGDFIEYSKGDSGQQFYQITNNNAHSWVEVFFPGQGWIPFEPTKGFTGDTQFSYENEGTNNPGSKTTEPLPLRKPPPQQDESTGKTVQKPMDAKVTKSLADRVKQVIWKIWKQFIWILVVVSLIAVFLYKIRSKWYPYVLILRFRWSNGDEQFGKAYLELLKQFERYGIKRKNGQTLRNYASYIDFFFSTSEMSRFTDHYEQFIYYKQLPSGSWSEMRELWENLIKKTIT